MTRPAADGTVNWCAVCSHVHIDDMPETTYRCRDCGFGQHDVVMAIEHQEKCPGHQTFAILHSMTRVPAERVVQGTGPWSDRQWLQPLASDVDIRGPRLEGQTGVPRYMQPLTPVAQLRIGPNRMWEAQVAEERGSWWIRQRPYGSEHWHLWQQMEAPDAAG